MGTNFVDNLFSRIQFSPDGMSCGAWGHRRGLQPLRDERLRPEHVAEVNVQEHALVRDHDVFRVPVPDPDQEGVSARQDRYIKHFNRRSKRITFLDQWRYFENSDPVRNV